MGPSFYSMYFSDSETHISLIMLHVFLWKSYFSVSKLDQLEQVLGVTVDMFGVSWTVPSWYRPPPAAQPTIFNRIPVFLPELKRGSQPPGSSWCGLPGSDNVCSRSGSHLSKVNHPRLNYWHPSTDGGLNYDALNQTGGPAIRAISHNFKRARRAKYQYLKPVR